MTDVQKEAFYQASGFTTSGLTFDIRLLVGGIAIICSILILIGLVHLLNSNSPWDKNIFFLSLFALAFSLMLIFVYIA
jgi:hypothetical protein